MIEYIYQVAQYHKNLVGIGIKCIESIDTSNPVMAALEGITYSDTGLDTKPKANMNDFFDIDFRKVDYLNVIHNVRKFKEIVKKHINN